MVQIAHTTILCILLILPGIVKAQEKEPAAKLNSLIESCQFSKVVTLADYYLSLDSTRTDLLLLKGKAYAATFQYRESVNALQKARRLDSTNIKVLNELVNVYRLAGDPLSAISTSLLITKIDPENRYFSLQLANLYFSENEYRKALQILIPLYNVDTSVLYVVKQTAICFDELKRYDSAIIYYIRALKVSPYEPIVTGKLANLYIRLNRFPDALALTQIYLEQDPGNIPILKQNAYCNYQIRNYPASATKFRECFNLGDSSKFTYKYLGMCYYKQEKYDTAAPFLRSAFIRDTSDTEICFYYGISESRSWGIDTGLVYLNRTLRLLLPPGSFLSTLYIELANAYTAKVKFDTAVVFLQKAFEANPQNNTIKFKIAYQYDYYLRKPKDALPYYREFLDNAERLNQTGAQLPNQALNTGPAQNTTGDFIFTYGDYAKNRIREITAIKKKTDN